MTEEEIVGFLKHSSLPCVLVEGKDDMSFYSWYSGNHMPPGAFFFPCGGRDILFSVFHRRHEYRSNKVAFLADRDMSLFSGIPAEFNEIVFTHGYSIENDVLCCTAINRLMTANERMQFDSILKELAKWFSFEVNEHLSGRIAKVDIHINQLLQPGAKTLKTDFESIRGYQGLPSRSLKKRIKSNPRLYVRGKNILQLYARLLSAPKRSAKHNEHSIMEIAVKFGRSKYIKKLIFAISQRIN